jgi:hypothetical protein
MSLNLTSSKKFDGTPKYHMYNYSTMKSLSMCLGCGYNKNPIGEVYGVKNLTPSNLSLLTLLSLLESCFACVNANQGVGLIIIAVVVAAFFIYGKLREKSSARASRISARWKSRKTKNPKWRRRKTWE